MSSQTSKASSLSSKQSGSGVEMFAFVGSPFVSILFLQEDSAHETSPPSFLKGIHHKNKERERGRGGFSLAEWGWALLLS